MEKRNTLIERKKFKLTSHRIQKLQVFVEKLSSRNRRPVRLCTSHVNSQPYLGLCVVTAILVSAIQSYLTLDKNLVKYLYKRYVSATRKSLNLSLLTNHPYRIVIFLLLLYYIHI